MMIETAYLDDLKLHDVGDYLHPLALRESNLGSSPEPRTVSETRPSADGSLNRTRYWGPRILELVGYIGDVTPAASAERLEELRAALDLRTPHELRFRPVGSSEELTMRVVCASKLDCPAAGWMPILRWGVTLEAPDPRFYGVAWHDLSYEPGESTPPTTGLHFPLEFPLDFTVVGGGGSGGLNAWNAGSAPTPVLLTVRGPASALTAILNETSGERIAFVGPNALGFDQELAVDTGTREVTLDHEPTPWLIDASANTFFELRPGENLLSLEGSGFTDDETRLTARYRDARF